jgi:hypothetical protein
VFPLTLTRTGGIAGFQDVLVVAGNGRVSVTRRAAEAGRLPAHVGGRQAGENGRVPGAMGWPHPGRRPGQFPDDMVVMVRSPAGGPVRLEDPKVGASGKVFQSLLDDVLSGPAAVEYVQGRRLTRPTPQAVRWVSTSPASRHGNRRETPPRHVGTRATRCHTGPWRT